MKREENSGAAAALLVFLRLLLGGLLLVDGVHSVRELLPEPKLLVEVLEARVPDAPFPFSWIGEVGLERPESLSAVLRWGSLLGGLALVIGALTRPAGAAIATGHLCAYFLGLPADQYYHLLAAGVAASCALGSAGRMLGMDGSLDTLLPGWLTWAGKYGDPARERMFM